MAADKQGCSELLGRANELAALLAGCKRLCRLERLLHNHGWSVSCA